MTPVVLSKYKIVSGAKKGGCPYHEKLLYHRDWWGGFRLVSAAEYLQEYRRYGFGWTPSYDGFAGLIACICGGRPDGG